MIYQDLAEKMTQARLVQVMVYIRNAVRPIERKLDVPLRV
jgi:hypothetical protein